MAELTTHGKCGKSWKQRGNRTGHCAGCHETFEGLSVFDAHQRIGDGGTVVCLPPEEVTVNKSPLRLVDGTWRGPGLPEGVTFGVSAA